MSQPSTPATLPALNSSGAAAKTSNTHHSKLTTTSSTMNDDHSSTAGTLAAAAASSPLLTDNTPAMDYVALYRQYCTEEGCKANSAFVRYIQDRGGHFSLERLNLGHNYLGSKGLRPVLRMIDLCQTIVSINLEDNGIGNEAVSDLCAVLERHVSITSLNLSRNPISVVGGKRLLQLAETNERITEIFMEGTDIFDGLQERIRMQLQHNVTVTHGSGPQMEANKSDAAAAQAAWSSATVNGVKGGMDSGPSHRPSPPPPLPSSVLGQPRGKGTAAATLPPPKAASLQPLSASSPSIKNNSSSNGSRGKGPANESAAGDGNTQSRKAAATSEYSSPRLADTSAASTSVWQEAAVGKTQPRPPAPAIASHASKALPLNKVKDLKALFAERARLHTEVNRGEASKRAYAAREELQALERHGRPISDDVSGAMAQTGQTYPGASPLSISANTSTTATTTIPLQLPPLPADASTPAFRNNNNSTNNNNNNGSSNTTTTVRVGGDGGSYGGLRSNSAGGPTGVGSARRVVSASSNNNTNTNTYGNATTLQDAAFTSAQPQTSEETNFTATVRQLSATQIDTVPSPAGDEEGRNGNRESAAQGQVSAAPRTPPPLPSPPSTDVAGAAPSNQQVRPQAHTVEDVLVPSRMMLLTTEEQFTVLFDQGCREYLNRNLDAAYMAWNEAMRLAVAEGQREWMAVVASNLQRLSYELLVEEGATHLEHGELEKAGETFNLALEVAVKAKNAVWERDMRLAKQNVQKALFHRCHEAALLLFSRAQEDARDASSGGGAAEVTEDDYFVLPGTEEMIRHTPAFVREWSCLLLLKEAIGLWVEGTRVVSRLSEVAAAPLRENITEALNLVASFIVQRHFNDAPPTGLLWFHTDTYLYHECVLLSDLWYDLVADSEQSLKHPLLSAICAAQLGELYVATFQLPQALVQLEKLVRYGRVHRSAVLEATGLTLCGRVHVQRANHALAETALDAALALWSSIQADPEVRRALEAAATPFSQTVAPMDAAAVAAEMTGSATMPTSATDALALTTKTTASDATTTTNTATTVAATTAAAKRNATTTATTTSGGSGLQFRVEAHLPRDAIAVLSSACRHYKVLVLLQTYRYRDALEALECGLNVAYSDTLQEKLGRNYRLNPSVDEIAAIAGVLRTSLVFYTLTSRYDWSVSTSSYQVEESLCIWVLAESREMRFVEVNLTKDFKCSMQELLDTLRQQLCVEPQLTLQPEIITELPSRSWQEPLRVLYQVCIHPIIGYLRAADPQLLFGDGVITVVPTGKLWLVPFHALLNVKAADRYLVEEVAIQLAFSATQAAFAALSATRVQQRDLHREVVAVQTTADRSVADSLFYTAFPANTDRSLREGEAVSAILKSGQVQAGERQMQQKRNARETAVFTHRVEVVESVEALRAVLPRARTLHVATATTAAPPCLSSSLMSPALSAQLDERRSRQRAEDEGGLLLSAASPMADVGILRSAEIAHLELFAEHVVLTNTNMSREHVSGIRDDVLGLVRSFFGSGVPCVICGQWCTPEMEPMELFQRFYTLWCRPSSSSGSSLSATDASLRTATHTSVNAGTRGSASRISELASDAATATNNNEAAVGGGGNDRRSADVPQQQQQQRQSRASRHSGSSALQHDGDLLDGAEEEGESVRHRALLLARAIRRLLAEEPAKRYQPRVWAGYYCIGTGW